MTSLHVVVESHSNCRTFIGEENKNLHYSNASNGMGGTSRQQASKQTERVRNLKEFHQNFNSTFQPSHSVHNSADDVQVRYHNSLNGNGAS